MDLKVIEFPITIPNQAKVESIIHVSMISSIFISLFLGVITNNLLVLVASFTIQFIITLLLVLPNWSIYKQQPQLQWLQVKF